MCELLEGMLTFWRRGKALGRNEQPHGIQLPRRYVYVRKLAATLTAQKLCVRVLHVTRIEAQVVWKQKPGYRRAPNQRPRAIGLRCQ